MSSAAAAAGEGVSGATEGGSSPLSLNSDPERLTAPASPGELKAESPQLEASNSDSDTDESDLHRTPLPPPPTSSSSSSTAGPRTRRPKAVLDPKVDYTEFNVHVVTWNIASIGPSPHDVESLFLPQEGFLIKGLDVLRDSDIIVVGLQEAYQSVQDAMQSNVPLVGKDPLVELFSTVLCQKGFVRLSASRLLGILTMVFVKQPLLCYIRAVETCTTKTGFSGWLGNKGASSIHFTLGDISLCFTNCHLCPHLENNTRRVQELAEIVSSQEFSSRPAQLMDHDITVLFGDLNFRLEGKSVEQVMESLSRGWGPELLDYDQLYQEQIRGPKSGCNLYCFVESPISFPPSYKYRPGSDDYDPGAKMRAPAWCDRILWRSHQRRLPRITDPNPRAVLSQRYYALHKQPRTSDHKAVSAGLTVSVNLMKFIPRVIFHIMTEWVAGKCGEITFEMTEGTEVSLWDWVGLYPATFASVEKDYVFYVYTPARGKSKEKKSKFTRTLHPNQVPSQPGKYLLMYSSTCYNRVLGMSPIFTISKPPTTEVEDKGSTPSQAP